MDQIDYRGQVVSDSLALGVEDDRVLDDHGVEMLHVEHYDQNYLNLSFDSLVFLCTIKILFNSVLLLKARVLYDISYIS